MNLMSSAAALLPDRLFVALIARAHRRFEPELGRIVAAYPGSGTVLDVGAWYGPWTYWLSRRATSVVAFEPNPDVADVLEGAVRPNVRLIRGAASAEAGTAVLSLPAGGRGTEGRASLAATLADGRSIEVPTLRLDELEVTDVRLVKIDVEGHELEALHGAERLLATQHPVVVVELEERHGGITPSVEFLAGLGYEGMVLDRGAWIGLDRFDLVAHQRAHDEVATRGYLFNAFVNRNRYLNNVVFVHPASSWRPDR